MCLQTHLPLFRSPIVPPPIQRTNKAAVRCIGSGEDWYSFPQHATCGAVAFVLLYTWTPSTIRRSGNCAGLSQFNQYQSEKCI